MAGGAAGPRRLGKGSRRGASDLSGGKRGAERSGRAPGARRPALAPHRPRRRWEFVMTLSPRFSSTKISALVSDVDGTLVTYDKILTARAQTAVAALRAS